jgi:probable HAF family extracellular repeat protein
VPGASSTRANGINSRGQIAGSYTDAAKVNHGFVFSDGVFTTFDFPSPGTTIGYLTINPQGDLAGVFKNSAGDHGFVLSAGNLSTIDFPGAKWTHVHGLNAAGEIAGMYGDQAGKTHGYGLLLPR